MEVLTDSKGFSGSPVWCTDNKAILGLLLHQNSNSIERARALPAKYIVECLKVKIDLPLAEPKKKGLTPNPLLLISSDDIARMVYMPRNYFIRTLFRLFPSLDKKKNFIDPAINRNRWYESKSEFFSFMSKVIAAKGKFHKEKEFDEIIRAMGAKTKNEINTLKASYEKNMHLFFGECFFKEKKFHYALVLADSGMGKTTFLRKCYADFAKNYPDTPLVFIYARNESTIAELAAIPKKVKEKAILFLDAIDEDYAALKEIVKFKADLGKQIEQFDCAIVTARPQMFKNCDAEWKNLFLSEDYARVMELGFGRDNAVAYLRDKYSHDRIKQNKALSQLTLMPDFLSRPLILSWFDDLLPDGDTFLLKRNEVFEKIVENWMDREDKRVKVVENFKLKFIAYSKKLAMHLFRTENHQLDELLILAAEIGLNEEYAQTRTLLT